MIRIFYIIAAVALFASCGGKQAPAVKENTADTTAALNLTDERMKLMGIQLGGATRTMAAPSITVRGMIVVLPSDKASITSAVSGKAEQFYIHEGQDVSAGTALLSIASNEWVDMQQQYLRDKASLSFLLTELERQKTLVRDNAGALKDLQQTESNVQITRASMEANAARIRNCGADPAAVEKNGVQRLLVIKAPISGNVSSISINIGSSVSQGTPICSIISGSDLHAHLELPQREALLAEVGQLVSLSIPGITDPVQSKIEYISRELDPATKTMALHVHIPENLKPRPVPQMQVDATIRLKASEGLALPSGAAVMTDQGYIIYMAQKSGKGYSLKSITLPFSARNGEVLLLPATLQADSSTLFVTKGSSVIESEMKRSEMEE